MNNYYEEGNGGSSQASPELKIAFKYCANLVLNKIYLLGSHEIYISCKLYATKGVKQRLKGCTSWFCGLHKYNLWLFTPARVDLACYFCHETLYLSPLQQKYSVKFRSWSWIIKSDPVTQVPAMPYQLMSMAGKEVEFSLSKEGPHAWFQKDFLLYSKALTTIPLTTLKSESSRKLICRTWKYS